MAKKTAKPKLSGLTVARKDNKFTLTWSKIKNCTDQDIYVYVNDKKTTKNPIDLSKTAKKYEYTVNLSNYYPNVESTFLTEVAFKLAQKQKKKTESKFSSQKQFKIQKMGQPGYVQPIQDNTNTDTFTYSWTKHEEDDDPREGHKMFTYYEYWTCLVGTNENPNWSLANTQKIQTIDPTTGQLQTNQPSHGTITDPDIKRLIIRESQADITARKKRYFQVRAVGPAGPSDVRQSEHQLGGTDPIKVQPSTTVIKGSTSTGTAGTIPLDVPNGNPNDSIQVEYAVTAPYVSTTQSSDTVISSLSLPNGFNSWTVGDTFSGTGQLDTYTFNFPTFVVEDTTLFVRINRIHDNIVSYGLPVLMNSNGDKSIKIGTLSEPTLNSVSVNEGTHEVTITATNNAQLADGGNRSFIAVFERVGDNGAPSVIGIIPYSSSASTVTFPYDDEADQFGIQCFVANYTPISRSASGVTKYTISGYLMQSSGIIWETGAVSKPPAGFKVSRYNATTALVQWEWNWAQADSTEISWSDNKIIWESIEEPSTYILSNTREGKRYITGLSPTTYYFRVRFIKTDGDLVTYGVYSKTLEQTMSSAPDIPTMTLSDEDHVVALDDTVTAYWNYKSTDGTPQSFAQLAKAERANPNAAWTYTDLPKLKAETNTQISFTPRALNLGNNDYCYICVKVRSGSGEDSEGYSTPILLRVAPLPVISISGIGGTNDAIRPPVSGDASYGIADLALKKLPLTFTVSGAGKGGYCNVVIERDENFNLERPDDTSDTGYDKETIISRRLSVPANSSNDTITVTITPDDLKLGSLDNTAKYKMYVSITDGYGQTVSHEPYSFVVDWDYYSQMPEATITYNYEEDAAYITPTAPSQVATGDYCQIYRMSADKPQLVLDNGEFGETYVDPYPTFGLFGGYRIVYVSKYGDYKTVNNEMAMTEYSRVGNDEDLEPYDKFMVSLDFDGYSTEFKGNISLSHSWGKDFQLTRYLGGSMQGDWNPGIQRTGTINGTVPIEQEFDTAYNLRMLADYAGRCHVRTPEGSNFIADVQVKDDREEKWTTRLGKFSLSYTKVDGGEEDMVLESEWRKDHPLSE